MVWSASSELKSQVERYITARSEDFLRKRSRQAKEAESDSARRGLLGSPMHVGRIAAVWAELLSEHARELFDDFKGLLERLGQLEREPAAWILRRFVSHLDGLTLGTVKSLADYARHQGEPGARDSGAEVLKQASAVARADARRKLEIAVGEAELVRMHRTGAPVQPGSSPPKKDELDDLVPLLRKAVFRPDLEAMLKEAKAEGYPLALIVIDGDGFKSVNDQHGHDVGDEVIRDLGELIAQRIKKRGKGYRFGGDEFAILLPNHSDREATALAESLREGIQAVTFGGGQVRLTATLGVAVAQDGDPDDLFRRADQALLRAKEAGRNRVGMG